MYINYVWVRAEGKNERTKKNQTIKKEMLTKVLSSTIKVLGFCSVVAFVPFFFFFRARIAFLPQEKKTK